MFTRRATHEHVFLNCRPGLDPSDSQCFPNPRGITQGSLENCPSKRDGLALWRRDVQGVPRAGPSGTFMRRKDWDGLTRFTSCSCKQSKTAPAKRSWHTPCRRAVAGQGSPADSGTRKLNRPIGPASVSVSPPAHLHLYWAEELLSVASLVLGNGRPMPGLPCKTLRSLPRSRSGPVVS